MSTLPDRDQVVDALRQLVRDQLSRQSLALGDGRQACRVETSANWEGDRDVAEHTVILHLFGDGWYGKAWIDVTFDLDSLVIVERKEQ